MNINIYAAQSLPPSELQKVAGFVSDYTSSHAGLEARLLPLGRAEVSGRMGFIACEGFEFRGYAGVSPPPSSGESERELGPFIVESSQRRQGIGAMLIAAASSAVLQEGYLPYVFGNATNMGNLGRRGFRPAKAADLSLDPYQMCETRCPLFELSRTCCNTPVVLREISESREGSNAIWPDGRVIQLPTNSKPSVT